MRRTWMGNLDWLVSTVFKPPTTKSESAIKLSLFTPMSLDLFYQLPWNLCSFWHPPSAWVGRSPLPTKAMASLSFDAPVILFCCQLANYDQMIMKNPYTFASLLFTLTENLNYISTDAVILIYILVNDSTCKILYQRLWTNSAHENSWINNRLPRLY